MSNTSNLSFKNGDWYAGCGCGGKPKTKIVPPEGSVPVLVYLNGVHAGPITGIQYNIYPNEVSIDIAEDDAVFWIASHDAIPFNGHSKGRLTRI